MLRLIYMYDLATFTKIKLTAGDVAISENNHVLITI